MARSRKKSYSDVSKVRRMLRRAPEEMTKEIKAIIRKGSEDVIIEAKTRAPADSGVLRANISAKVSRDGLAATMGILGKRAQRRAYYAHFIEFGTRSYAAGDTRVSKDSKTTKKIRKRVAARPAHPFLRPAREVVMAKISQDLFKNVQQVLDKLTQEAR